MERAALLGALALVVATLALLFARHQWIDSKLDLVRHPPPIRRDSEAACSGGLARLTIMIGDSRLSRWPVDLLPEPDIVNLGIAGETALQMAARFGPDVLARCPDTIVIASGINDLVAASLMDEDEGRAVADRVIRTLIELAESGARIGAHVYVATIIPPARPDLLRRLVWSWSVTGSVLHANAELRAHHWQGAVSIIDFAALLDPGSSGMLDGGFRDDTLHLSRSAYAKLRDATRSALNH